MVKRLFFVQLLVLVFSGCNSGGDGGGGDTSSPGTPPITSAPPPSTGNQQPLSPEEKVNGALDALTADDILNLNTDLNSITSDLVLPDYLNEDVNLTWKIDSAFISELGVITRPDYTEGDQTVDIIATLSIEDQIKEKIFTLKIKALPIPDEVVLQSEYDKLTAGLIVLQNSSLYEVTSDLNLVSTLGSGVQVSWTESSNYITSSGSVQRPNYITGNEELTLKATLKLNELLLEKEFTVVILADELGDIEAVRLASDLITEESILLSNSSLKNITSKLKLPSLGSFGTTIYWNSTVPYNLIDTDSGEIAENLRFPRVGKLTANIYKGSSWSYKQFIVTVTFTNPAQARAYGVLKSIGIADIIGANLSRYNISSSFELTEVRVKFPDCDIYLTTSYGTLNRDGKRQGNLSYYDYTEYPKIRVGCGGPADLQQGLGRITYASASEGQIKDTDLDGLSDREEREVYFTNPSVSDSDGDGFSDSEEVLPTGKNGVSLVDLGANPNVRDIFIEIDYMASPKGLENSETDTTKSFKGLQIFEESLRKVQLAFAAYDPEINGGKKTPFKIHFDIGDLFDKSSGLNPEKFDLGGGQEIPFQSKLRIAYPGSSLSHNDLKQLYFDPSRQGIFHYLIWGYEFEEHYNPKTGYRVTSGIHGLAEIPGNDFAICIGWVSVGNSVYSHNMQAMEIMHELGHNLGLSHDGSRKEYWGRKPNYPSIMSYQYTYYDSDIEGNGWRYYSSSSPYRKKLVEIGKGSPMNLHSPDYLPYYSYGLNIGLDEDNMSEKMGWSGIFIDYNKNGVIDDAKFQKDFNSDGNKWSDHVDFNDWANLKLDFGGHPYYND
ncbi:MAG: hypothetical protein HOE90_14635 [Bacteriovoracaceae bacterium]|jgi:hypothetical protein|nr:hypothetical protein [Bacteriovoracaceae bacterium]